MKICRFQPLHIPIEQVRRRGEELSSDSVEPSWGVVAGENIREVSGSLTGEWKLSGRTWPLAEVQLVAPIEPGKIVCVGRNYREHAAELGNPIPTEPLIFLKPPSSVIGPGEPIVLPAISERVDHEGELAVVIGRPCAHLGEADDVRPFIFGYTCLNDVTARDLQRKDGQFARSKGFDTFCPIGPVIETELDLADVSVETFVNGQRRQAGRTSQMIFPVDHLIRWVSRMMTLVPGDVIATGSPAGVGPLRAGDVVEVAVGGVGTLRNPVMAASL